MPPRIRFASEDDLPELTRIYNYYIVETPVTFDLEPQTVAQRREWLADFDSSGPHRCYVADVDGRALGWACSKTFRTKAAYDSSVETSIYLDNDVGGQGIGSMLYAALLAELERSDVHMAVAGATLPNPASVALHKRFGFRSIGVFREIGRKFDRFWDVEWFERQL